MVVARKIPLPKQYGQSRSVQFSAEKTINYFSETNPNGGLNLYGRPGLTLFADIDSKPVYALHTWKDNVYTIVGNNLYKVDLSGGYSDLGSIGTVTQNIQIFDNPNELIILNNQNGATFTYDEVNGLRAVDDTDFRNPTSGAFLDGYAIFSERDTDVFFISGIDNARTYDALDFASAEASSDKLVRVFSTLKFLWCFGQSTIQVFQNTGAADFPFRSIAGTNFQQGCGAALSVAQIKNIMFWLGEDGTVWQYSGGTKKVSTYAIDDAISKFDRIDNAVGFSFSEGGHNFYCLTFPENGSFVYDLNEGAWHEWKTFEQDYWTITSQTFAFGKNIVGDATTGKLYYLDLTNYTDNTNELIGEIVLPNLFNDTNDVKVDRLEVRFEAGVGLLTGQGSDPEVMLQKSKDGGKTYSKEIWRKISKRGEYDNFKCVWRNLGSGSNVTFKIKISDPVKRDIEGIYGVIRGGTA